MKPDKDPRKEPEHREQDGDSVSDKLNLRTSGQPYVHTHREGPLRGRHVKPKGWVSMARRREQGERRTREPGGRVGDGGEEPSQALRRRAGERDAARTARRPLLSRKHRGPQTELSAAGRALSAALGAVGALPGRCHYRT